MNQSPYVTAESNRLVGALLSNGKPKKPTRAGPLPATGPTGWPVTSANESSRLLTPGGNERWKISRFTWSSFKTATILP